MKNINIIFPNQLFKNHEIHSNGDETFLIEEYLFFNQYNFHKTKIAYHRASMKFYENHLKKKNLTVHYINSYEKTSDIRKFIDQIALKNITSITYIDPVDEWLHLRIKEKAKQNNIKLNCLESQLFLNTNEDLKLFFKPDKKKFYHATFYKQQRVKNNILIKNNDKPIGDKWSFDSENRKKYPAKNTPPNIIHPSKDQYWEEAIVYVNKYFKNNIGEILTTSIYPHTFDTAQDWLFNFLENRFYAFGDYEDAILKNNTTLHHSIISPMLNIGLIEPKEVIEKALIYAEQNNININSTEGFIRQIIGWREFIRGMYTSKGNYSRTKNFWNFTRKIPSSFYTGDTGILPIDNTIKSILKNGYCHHIERLMVLGNFMLLCEFAPNEVYKWFMELFIDAYDWVMVPNVYGMSQFADGGLFATKPYISSSNYIIKMSDYSKTKGDWQKTWDGLFWSFMSKNRDFFNSSPRLNMLLKNLDKMGDNKKNEHFKNANLFFNSIS